MNCECSKKIEKLNRIGRVKRTRRENKRKHAAEHYFHNISLALFWSHSHTQTHTRWPAADNGLMTRTQRTRQRVEPPSDPPFTWHLSRRTQTNRNCLMHFDTLCLDATRDNTTPHKMNSRRQWMSWDCLEDHWSLGRSFVMRHISCNLCQVSLICFSFFVLSGKLQPKRCERERQRRAWPLFAHYAYAAWVMTTARGQMHSEKHWEMWGSNKEIMNGIHFINLLALHGKKCL